MRERASYEQPEDLLGTGLCGVKIPLALTLASLKLHQHLETFSLLASTEMKANVKIVCAPLSSIMPEQMLQRPIEQL